MANWSEVSRPRTVSVLFSDVVGSTELFTAMGDDAADALRREHFDGVGTVIADHGGQLVKSLGDGTGADRIAPSDENSDHPGQYVRPR
ncbi:MAG: hypothetical protein ACRDZU_10530 [Acidimicrobiales bacterium]